MFTCSIVYIHERVHSFYLLRRFWDVCMFTCRSVIDFILNVFPLLLKSYENKMSKSGWWFYFSTAANSSSGFHVFHMVFQQM